MHTVMHALSHTHRPETWSWQHFVDSALPKIFAARELMLQHPEILISIDQSKSASPGKVLELIGLANRTVKGGYRQGSCAKYIYNACGVYVIVP